MAKKLVILGGEGNGGVVAACVEDMSRKCPGSEYEIAGFLNDYHDGTICGYPVLGKIDSAKDWAEKGYMLSYAIHPIGHGSLRVELFDKLGIPDSSLATIVHPSAFVASSAVLEPGVFVMANCYIGPQTKLSKSAFVMANSVVGHNDSIGPFCHLSAGSVVSSYVSIGKASDICLAASVLEKVSIGDYCVIGAKSLLTKSTGDSEMYIGVPAKLHRNIEKKEYSLREG